MSAWLSPEGWLYVGLGCLVLAFVVALLGLAWASGGRWRL